MLNLAALLISRQVEILLNVDYFNVRLPEPYSLQSFTYALNSLIGLRQIKVSVV